MYCAVGGKTSQANLCMPARGAVSHASHLLTIGRDLRLQTVGEEQSHDARRDAAAVEGHLEVQAVGVRNSGRVAQVLCVCRLEERTHLSRPVLGSRRRWAIWSGSMQRGGPWCMQVDRCRRVSSMEVVGHCRRTNAGLTCLRRDGSDCVRGPLPVNGQGER